MENAGSNVYLHRFFSYASTILLSVPLNLETDLQEKGDQTTVVTRKKGHQNNNNDKDLKTSAQRKKENGGDGMVVKGKSFIKDREDSYN